ncbi:TPA: LuxR family transcriptional regulator [Pseudomonas aeruginosa]
MSASEIEIPVWPNCSPIMEAAVRELVANWRPYSSSARRFPIRRLIEQLIDPAIALLCVDAVFQRYMLGAPGTTVLSDLIHSIHYKGAMRAQRVLIRQYISATRHTGEQSREVIGTLETLVEVIGACGRKRPARSRCTVEGVTQNAQRNRDFCEVCGQPSELAHLINTGDWPESADTDYALHLSNRYCASHRPRHADGTWNPQYQRAKRSKNLFNLELARLTEQSAQRTPSPKHDTPAAELFAFHITHSNGLTAADEGALREQARLMIDARLTDVKKQMLILRASGLNQSEIARRMGISRQAVSKALGSIPSSLQFADAPEHPVH